MITCKMRYVKFIYVSRNLRLTFAYFKIQTSSINIGYNRTFWAQKTALKFTHFIVYLLQKVIK